MHGTQDTNAWMRGLFMDMVGFMKSGASMNIDLKDFCTIHLYRLGTESYTWSIHLSSETVALGAGVFMVTSDGIRLGSVFIPFEDIEQVNAEIGKWVSHRSIKNY